MKTEEAPVGIAEFGSILRRRWKTIATTTAIVTTLGLGYAFTAKSSYMAATAIFIDPRNKASFQIEGSGTGAGYDPNLVDSQTLVIESDAVLRRVIADEKLQDDAEFANGPGDAASNTLRNLQEGVKVKRPDRTYVVEIQVRTQSAEKSARIANAIARAYLSDGRDSKSETAQREQSWLETHLKQLQDRLKEAEARVETYKQENKILGVEGKLIGEQQLSELNRGLVDAQRKAAEAKAALDQVEALRKGGRVPDSTVEALKSPVIDRLRGQLAEISRLDANARSTLGPRHPAAIEVTQQKADVLRLIREELERIAAGARSAYVVASGNVKALERQLERLKSDATGINRTLLRLRELERAVDAQKAVYEKFLRDKEQIARLTVDTPAGRVIAPAVAPLRRAWPNRPLILALSLFGGLFLGVALALLLETLSQARKGQRKRGGFAKPPAPQASAQDVPIPVLPSESMPELLAVLPAPADAGAVRWVGRGARKGTGTRLTPDAVLRAPHSAYAKEIQNLAERISAMVGPHPGATVMVTGMGGGHGSPTLAANLAHALAGRGLDILLVDGAGGAHALTAQLGNNGATVQAEFGGSLRPVIALSSRLAFLPFGGVKGARPAMHGQRPRRIGLTLIDGPAIGSAALDQIDIDRRIDGVIALVSPNADGRIAAELGQRFGDSLIGVVRQSGGVGRAA
ncbi:MAG TPA: GumC family protein [Rhabdaerophilum sp.]|nr:GumC family protein [Rhabdaerophilum sp.]